MSFTEIKRNFVKIFTKIKYDHTQNFEKSDSEYWDLKANVECAVNLK